MTSNLSNHKEYTMSAVSPDPDQDKFLPNSLRYGSEMSETRYATKMSTRTISPSFLLPEKNNRSVGGTTASKNKKTLHHEDNEALEIESLKLRVRELEEEKSAEDGLRARIKELENELAMRRARTQHLNAMVDLVKSCDRANEAAANYLSSSRHARARLRIQSSKHLVHRQGWNHAESDTFYSPIYNGARNRKAKLRYDRRAGQGALSTVPRSRSAEFFQDYPNKKQRQMR